MEQNKTEKKKKFDLDKRTKLIILAVSSLFVILGVVLAAVWLTRYNNFTSLDKEEADSSVESGDERLEFSDGFQDDGNGGLFGGEEVVFQKVVPLVGNSSITPEREVLLESGIIKTIEKTNTLIPLINENGNYYTDENGFLVCKKINVRDYTGMRENLIIIANSFADDGYPIEPIWCAQRLYFEYYDRFSEYSTEELLGGLKEVFLKSGNTVEAVNERVMEVFNIHRADECSFVFGSTLAPADITPYFSEVELQITYEWRDEYEQYCIYDEWIAERGENDYNRNLEHTLHIIVCKMVEKGASEYDIRLAQLIYSSYLADIKYTPEWLLVLYDAFGEGTPDYVLLCENMRDIFGEDMNGNKMIADYYDGTSKYLGGGAK
ncbi:MAG: hypothetical protein J6Q78_02675 [Clostridia bacterium]|nr:hypothetical protein [Clostridia bacterium]